MDPRYKSPTTELVDTELEYEFRDLTTFTSVLVWMLRIGAALAVVGAWFAWQKIALLSGDHPDIEAAAIAAETSRNESLIAGATGLLMLATLFVFGRWIVVAHRNLPALGAQRLEFRPGWALGFFFIPILNWWKPYQAMRSLWRSSNSVHRPELQESPWMLPAWWTCWVVYSLVANGSWRSGRDGATFDLVENGVYGLLCVFASLVVSRIWNAQAHQRDNPEEAPRGFADAPA